jgi:hypothetical protein
MRALLSFALLSLLATTVAADPIIHVSGYGRETGHFAVSVPGDTLWLATRITSIDGAGDLPYAPATNEYTLVLAGLISEGEVTSGGVSTIHYREGRLAVFADPSFNSSWQDLPLGSQPPASFLDGELWLTASIADLCFTVWRDLGMGVFECMVALDGGSAQPWCPPFLTCGGTSIPAPPTFAEVGYDLAVDGELWQENVLAARNSLSRIKSLY